MGSKLAYQHLIWNPSKRSRATRIPEDSEDLIKEVLQEYYQKQDLDLSQVIDLLNTQHQVHVNKRQLTARIQKWSLLKRDRKDPSAMVTISEENHELCTLSGTAIVAQRGFYQPFVAPSLPPANEIALPIIIPELPSLDCQVNIPRTGVLQKSNDTSRDAAGCSQAFLLDNQGDLECSSVKPTKRLEALLSLIANENSWTSDLTQVGNDDHEVLNRLANVSMCCSCSGMASNLFRAIFTYWHSVCLKSTTELEVIENLHQLTRPLIRIFQMVRHVKILEDCFSKWRIVLKYWRSCRSSRHTQIPRTSKCWTTVATFALTLYQRGFRSGFHVVCRTLTDDDLSGFQIRLLKAYGVDIDFTLNPIGHIGDSSRMEAKVKPFIHQMLLWIQDQLNKPVVCSKDIIFACLHWPSTPTTYQLKRFKHNLLVAFLCRQAWNLPRSSGPPKTNTLLTTQPLEPAIPIIINQEWNSDSVPFVTLGILTQLEHEDDVAVPGFSWAQWRSERQRIVKGLIEELDNTIKAFLEVASRLESAEEFSLSPPPASQGISCEPVALRSKSTSLHDTTDFVERSFSIICNYVAQTVYHAGTQVETMDPLPDLAPEHSTSSHAPGPVHEHSKEPVFSNSQPPPTSENITAKFHIQDPTLNPTPRSSVSSDFRSFRRITLRSEDHLTKRESHASSSLNFRSSSDRSSADNLFGVSIPGISRNMSRGSVTSPHRSGSVTSFFGRSHGGNGDDDAMEIDG